MRRGPALVLAALALVLVLAGACTPREVLVERIVLPPAPPLAPPPAASGAAPLPPRNVANPFKNNQYWEGTYTCTQGETDLTLRITRVDGTHVDAEFQFDDANGTDGTFRVSGAYDPVRGEIRLKAGEWISRPANYEVVDLHGEVSENGTEIDGKIDHAGCGEVHLSLTEDEEFD